MSLTLTLLITIVVLSLISIVAAYSARKLKAEYNKLKYDNEKQKATIAELLRHAEEVSLITQDKGKVENEIKKAKTDQELVDIANAIVSANNNRVHK